MYPLLSLAWTTSVDPLDESRVVLFDHIPAGSVVRAEFGIVRAEFGIVTAEFGVLREEFGIEGCRPAHQAFHIIHPYYTEIDVVVQLLQLRQCLIRVSV